jgi:hypothetical protein
MRDNGTAYPGCGIRSRVNTGASFKAPTSITTQQTAETDTTNVSFIQSDGFKTMGLTTPALVGMISDGTWRVVWTGEINPPQTLGTVDFKLQVWETVGGVPSGPIVTITLSTATVTRTVDIPFNYNNASGGTYDVRGSFIGQTTPLVVQGAGTVTTTATYYYDEFTPDPDGVALQQQALVPGHSAAGGYGDNWTAASQCRMGGSNAMRMIAYQNGNTHKWALIAHAKVEAGTVNNVPGWVTFVSNQISGGSTVQVQIPGLGGGTGVTYFGLSQDSNVGGDNPNGYALITVQVSSITSNGGAVLQSFFRVNGTPAGRFSVAQIDSWGSGSFVMFGNKHWHPLPQPEDIFPETVPFLPFDGELAAWVTVLGSTTALANDTPTTYPVDGTGFPPGAGSSSGSVDPSGYNDTDPDTAGSYTASATEVERLEGGLAHRYGTSNFLPNGIGGAGPAPYADHPFGGAANAPSGFANDLDIDELARVLLSPRPIFGKLSSAGTSIVWAMNGSGLGNGCVALPDRFVATTGEKDPLDGEHQHTILRRIFDGGNPYSLAAGDIGAGCDRGQLVVDVGGA